MQMLRIEDVANKLNVSQKSVRRYIHSGKLKSNKVGGVHRVEESELQYFLKLSVYENGKEKELERTRPKSTKTDLINWMDISEEWDKPKKNEYTSADLFCGAGGMAKGFEMAGFHIALGGDIHAPAIETFQHNHPKSSSILGDIKKIKPAQILELIGGRKIDVLIAGVPCQGKLLQPG